MADRAAEVADWIVQTSERVADARKALAQGAWGMREYERYRADLVTGLAHYLRETFKSEDGRLPE